MADLTLELTPSALLAHLQRCLSLQQHNHNQPTTHNDCKVKPLNVLVAFSGGLDSHVLLHLLSQVPESELVIRAVYIDHGLQEQSQSWVSHCSQICKTLAIPYDSISLDIEIGTGESIEELARNARYQALFENLKTDEVLLTAHHQNDQAETMLLQLFRGAGVQGLSAMPFNATVHVNGIKHTHIRPLLDYSREVLEAYATSHSLTYINDPSNLDTAFDRNFLRKEVMPMLRQRWQGVDSVISRAANIQAQTSQLLDEIAAEQFPNVLSATSNHLARFIDDKNNATTLLPPIEIVKLVELSKAKQTLLLRYWITQQGFIAPSSKKLAHVFSDLIESSSDKQPLIEWRGAQLRRNQQCLYIMSPLSSHDVTQIIDWQNQASLYIPSLDIVLDDKPTTTASQNLTVRFRQGGEVINIPKRGNIAVKKLFQELHIPSWLRSRLPLIYDGETLIKIVGLEAFKRHPPPF